MKKFLIIISCIFTVVFISFYLFILKVIPAYVNSPEFITFAQNFAKNKYNAALKIDGIFLQFTPTLNAKLKIKSLVFNDSNSEEALYLNNFELEETRFKLKELNADCIHVNLDKLLSLYSSLNINKKDKSTTDFKLKSLPKIKIKELIITKDKNVHFVFSANNLEFSSDNINFKAKYQMDRIISDVYLGGTGKLYIDNNDLFAKDYLIQIGNFHFYLNGKILDNGKLGSIFLESNDIEAGELMKTLLFLQKFTDPTKKFIENFKNYKGRGYLKISYIDNKLKGYGKLTNVSANTVLFGLPLRVPVAEFFLENNEINSFATGFADKEVITHRLHMVNIMSKDRIAFGEVKTTITERMAKKYLPPEYKLKNFINLNIDYRIQHRKVTVKYAGYLHENTKISLHNFYFGNIDKERLITAETYKDGIKLYLKNYKYLSKDNGVYKELMVGDGFFINDNGKMFPKYITCKTNGFVPNSVAGYFGNYVVGGKFNGELKYDIPDKRIIGDFEVINTVFNKFYVKSAKVTADNNFMNVTANGTFRGEKFTCKGTAKNDFRGKIYVNNMDLFLDKFVINHRQSYKKETLDEKFEKYEQIEKQSKMLSQKVRKINMDIEKWQIKINLIHIDNVQLKQVLLNGLMENALFKYNIQSLSFANGILSANGIYDFNINKSVIDFKAKNIDSSIVAKDLFGISNQIEGIANATLHSETSKNLSNRKTYATFDILNGSLPQLQNLEFNDKNHKIKLSNYVRFKASKKGTIKSHLKGSFHCDETSIYDADIRLQHEFVSFFITGIYNYIAGSENVIMYGKYDNTAAHKTKVVAMPLSWLINLLVRSEKLTDNYTEQFKKVPPIGIDDKKAKFFVVQVKGYPAKNDFSVNIKIIKKQ